MKNTNLKLNKTKLIARLMLVILLLTSALTLASCGSNGLEDGFEGGGRDIVPSFVCAYKSDRFEFEIDDVTLTFYYGGGFGSDIEKEKRDRFNYPTFELYFVNDEETHILVKRVEENLVSEKYRTWIGRGSKRFFNHSEELTIPKELFTKERGMICFYVYGTDVLRNEEPEIICSIGINYNKENNTIILSVV